MSPVIDTSRAHLRGTQCDSGLVEQVKDRPRGMGVASTDIQPTPSSLRPNDPRLICYPSQHQTNQIFFQVSVPGGGRGRCAESAVAPGPSLCLSTPGPDPQGPEKGERRTSSDHSNCALLASKTLVCGTAQPISQTSMETTSSTSSTDAGTFTTPRSRVALSSRLDIERRALTQSQVSGKVIQTIQASRRPSTNRIYQATWQKFASWCTDQSIIPTQASVPRLLEFLQEGLDKGLKPNTLRRQVSAIASTMDCGAGAPLSRHPLVTRFLKGAVNISPPVVHRYPTWDLTLVLQALTQAPFEPLTSVPLRILSWKTAFLLAITTARRISELSALSVRKDLCKFQADHVVLRLDPTFLPKINSTFHRGQDLVIPDFDPDSQASAHALDVRTLLQTYIQETQPHRQTESLFVHFHKASLGRRASSTTIGRWIRSTIALAYKEQGIQPPDGVTAHSTRSAATTAAWATQTPIEQICRAATWSSPSAFIKHYKVDKFVSLDAQFGRNVLCTVHNKV